MKIEAPQGMNAPDRSPRTGTRDNPLLSPSPLPFGAPPFDRILDADFAPAFEAGIEAHLQEVTAIADDPSPPTFDNTLAALERSGELLTRVELIFNGLCSANTNATLQALQEEMAPKLAAHEDAIVLNERLFRRIESIYRERHHLDLDAESLRLTEYHHKRFVRAGATLAAADKARLRALNEEEAALRAKFVNQLLAGTQAAALVVDRVEDLDGLSEEELEAAAQAARAEGKDGQWRLPLHNTTQQPKLASLTKRATRERLFRASLLRTERGDCNDTREIVGRLAQLRAHRAALLGYSTHAAWSLDDQMAGNPGAVDAFLARLVPAALANARREARELQAAIDEQEERFPLAPWDWNLYAEQVRKARYGLDEAELAPYFELNRVLQDGVFYAARELYGLTFEPRQDIPTYDSDVRVFEVFDHDGTSLALFYCDYFERDNKNGGAWMDNYARQSRLLGTRPIVTNVANFSKPAPGQPALIRFDDVETMFHEFGHALHGILADSTYPTLSGAHVARDFVELPSQINEHWALDPTVLPRYAVHCHTGEPMPELLANRLREAQTFNQGYALTEVLGAVLLDLAWHSQPADAPAQDVNAFESRELQKAGVDFDPVPPRYRSSYFLHIWANGYDASYYAYLWAEMLDNDAFEWFTEHGGLTRANGDRFRRLILSRGNVADYAQIYREFRGKDPAIEPMLKRRAIAVSDE